MTYVKNSLGLLVLVLMSAPVPVVGQQASGNRTLDCVIEPNATVKIGSAVEGILREVAVSRGEQVKQGAVLARLDEELERLTAELAKLRAEVDVEVRSGKTQLNFRRRESRRMDDLRAKKVLAESEHDKAKVEESLASLTVEAATAENKIAQVEYQRAQENLRRRTILSPLDAVVVDVALSPGEYVHEQAPLMTLASVDPLYVEVFVPVSHFGKITKGMRAEVVPEEPVGGSYMAEVTVVDQVFDPASRTFGVRLQLPNPDYRLPAGLRCKVRFPG
jgi:RND family efflux transporter MFP subunit